MISFTLKGKNFPQGAKDWWPDVWYYVDSTATSRRQYPAKIPISQTATFTSVPESAAFAVGFFDAAGAAITGPYLFSSTDFFTLRNGSKYVLDFRGEVGVPILTEETMTPPEELPSWEKILVALLPWSPLDGPPLPMGFFPPWPLSIGNWMNIPGYPKILP